MKNYLSIGEVSKIKGVSIKSLRYYGELGIFPPAYINEENGYRYYTVDQLFIIDLIIVCISLDIPLKHFKSYISDDQTIDVARMFADGHEKVIDKIQMLNRSLNFLANMTNHIERTNEIKERQGKYFEILPKRYFLTIDWYGDINDYKDITNKYSVLFRQLISKSMLDISNQGILFYYQNGMLITKIFVETSSNTSSEENSFVVEEGEFSCEVTKYENLMNCIGNDFKICIATEMMTETVEPRMSPWIFEVQKIS